MVICLERGADLHMAQLMPLPLTVSCSSKIQIGFTFLVLAHLGRPGAVKRMYVFQLAHPDNCCKIQSNPLKRLALGPDYESKHLDRVCTYPRFILYTVSKQNQKNGIN